MQLYSHNNISVHDEMIEYVSKSTTNSKIKFIGKDPESIPYASSRLILGLMDGCSRPVTDVYAKVIRYNDEIVSATVFINPSSGKDVTENLLQDWDTIIKNRVNKLKEKVSEGQWFINGNHIFQRTDFVANVQNLAMYQYHGFTISSIISGNKTPTKVFEFGFIKDAIETGPISGLANMYKIAKNNFDNVQPNIQFIISTLRAFRYSNIKDADELNFLKIMDLLVKHQVVSLTEIDSLLIHSEQSGIRTVDIFEWLVDLYVNNTDDIHIRALDSSLSIACNNYVIFNKQSLFEKLLDKTSNVNYKDMSDVQYINHANNVFVNMEIEIPKFMAEVC